MKVNSWLTMLVVCAALCAGGISGCGSGGDTSAVSSGTTAVGVDQPGSRDVVLGVGESATVDDSGATLTFVRIVMDGTYGGITNSGLLVEANLRVGGASYTYIVNSRADLDPVYDEENPHPEYRVEVVSAVPQVINPAGNPPFDQYRVTFRVTQGATSETQ